MVSKIAINLFVFTMSLVDSSHKGQVKWRFYVTFLWYEALQTNEQTIKLPVISDVIELMFTKCNGLQPQVIPGILAKTRLAALAVHLFG